MQKMKIISTLIGLEKVIRNCYQELASATDYKAVLKKIRNYRSLEDEMFDKLYMFYSNSHDIADLKDSLSNSYDIFDEMSSLYIYTLFLDKNIEIKRILNKLSSFEVCNESDILSFSSDVLLEDEDEKDSDDESLTTDAFYYEKETLRMLIEYEDVIHFISRVDELSSFDVGDCYSLPLNKEQLNKIKYDFIFLTENLEDMLSGDFVIPLFFDSKMVASVKFGLDDERIEQSYDMIRQEDIFHMFNVLSQRKNQAFPSIQNSLRYFLIDIWVNTLDDVQFNKIMNKLEEKVNNSYNVDIQARRAHVYNQLYNMYQDRLISYEVIDEEEEVSIKKKS